MKKTTLTLIMVGMLLAATIPAQTGAALFGAQADFAIQVDQVAGILRLKVSVPEDAHITDLKNGFFQVQLRENEFFLLKEVHFPEGEPYGDETVFRGEFSVPLILESVKKASGEVPLVFEVSYQLCQEAPTEICFPPEDATVKITLDSGFSPGPVTEKPKSVVETSALAGTWMERAISRELDKGSFMLFLLVFLAGLLTSLTPCVYPVIPIVMGYMGTRSGGRKLKGFYLSLVFVLGMSLVYATLGVIAASTGSMMGLSFQNPVVVLIIAAVFILMGLSMAGLFDIPVPSSLSSKLQGSHKSELLGALVIGGVSGLVAAPCVGPVLIALLSWISQTGSIFLGFWLTFIFSLGMGIIFILAGTFSGVLAALPKGGRWMETVKHFFAFLLMAGGIYLISILTAGWADMLIWGIFLITASIFMGLFEPVDEVDVGNKLFKALVMIVFLVGGILFYQGVTQHWFHAASSEVSAAPSESASSLPWNSSLEKGSALAAEENKILMIDSWAEWCTACAELEHKTFMDPRVRSRMSEMVLVKLDFTRKDEAGVALRKKLGIIGMPTVIFRNAEGEELTRFSGYIDPEEFIKILDEIVK